MAKTRTFIAIEPVDAVRDRAAALINRLRPSLPGARWVDDEAIHLTLVFLGDLDDAQLAGACSAAEWVARANSPFDLRLGGLGVFPNPIRPSAVWLGVSEGADPLTRLQSDLEEAAADYAPRGRTRRFVPHATLARLGRNQTDVSRLSGLLDTLKDFDAGVSPVEEITVLGSDLRPQGPEYWPIAHCPLGPPA